MPDSTNKNREQINKVRFQFNTWNSFISFFWQFLEEEIGVKEAKDAFKYFEIE